MNYYDELVKAVKDQSGMTNKEIAAINDASDGYNGFIYYEETNEFYNKHEDLIWDILYEESQSEGINVLRYIASFFGADNVGSMEQFKNLLAWYALETASFYLSNKE